MFDCDRNKKQPARLDAAPCGRALPARRTLLATLSAMAAMTYAAAATRLVEETGLDEAVPLYLGSDVNQVRTSLETLGMPTRVGESCVQAFLQGWETRQRQFEFEEKLTQ